MQGTKATDISSKQCNVRKHAYRAYIQSRQTYIIGAYTGHTDTGTFDKYIVDHA